jgi:hypothetical protein
MIEHAGAGAVELERQTASVEVLAPSTSATQAAAALKAEGGALAAMQGKLRALADSGRFVQFELQRRLARVREPLSYLIGSTSLGDGTRASKLIAEVASALSICAGADDLAGGGRLKLSLRAHENSHDELNADTLAAKRLAFVTSGLTARISVPGLSEDEAAALLTHGPSQPGRGERSRMVVVRATLLPGGHESFDPARMVNAEYESALEYSDAMLKAQQEAEAEL